MYVNSHVPLFFFSIQFQKHKTVFVVHYKDRRNLGTKGPKFASRFLRPTHFEINESWLIYSAYNLQEPMTWLDYSVSNFLIYHFLDNMGNCGALRWKKRFMEWAGGTELGS